jgi:hypothetical protein
MTFKDPRHWLLLIHQIPPTPNALRVKIWRRLQQVGAVAIKPSVYAMPACPQAREDLSWILREIVAGGGDGSISDARFVEGLSDDALIALFREARKTEYDKLAQEAEGILQDWRCGTGVAPDGVPTGHGVLSKLRRRVNDIASIDFFQTPQRARVEGLLKELLAHLAGQKPETAVIKTAALREYQDRTWVTRRNLFVDRIACIWLIKRFVDRAAKIKLVREARYASQPGEVRFDMFDGEFTHQGDRCSFEVMIRRLQLQDHALDDMAEVVHDIDMKDAKFKRGETEGFRALLAGLVASRADDAQRMDEGGRLCEHLYAYFQRGRSENSVPET